MGSVKEAVAFHLSGLYERIRGRNRDELVVDPVCHMQVHPQSAAASVQHGEEEIFFCSTRCERRFESDPGKYLASRGPA